MSFEQWCIVEIFGHTRIAGKVTEQVIGGCSFIRVDVPKTENGEAFSKFYGQGAIYSISPCDEATAKIAAESYGVAPIEIYHLRLPSGTRLSTSLMSGQADDDDDDDGLGDDDDMFGDSEKMAKGGDSDGNENDRRENADGRRSPGSSHRTGEE